MSTPSRPSLVRHWLALAEELVGRAAPRLDALNLFPVPDADTGTNMLATLTAARTAADACPAQDDVGAVLAHAGAAALDSARGNSGMLLAVSLAGMAERLVAEGLAYDSEAGRAFAAAVVAGYVWLVGDEPSVQRAATMAAPLLAARFAGVRASPVAALALTGCGQGGGDSVPDVSSLSSSQSQETKDGLEGMQSLFETASQS